MIWIFSFTFFIHGASIEQGRKMSISVCYIVLVHLLWKQASKQASEPLEVVEQLGLT